MCYLGCAVYERAGEDARKRSLAGFKCEASVHGTLPCVPCAFGLFFYGDSDEPIFMIDLHHLTTGLDISYERRNSTSTEIVLIWRFRQTHNPRLDFGNRHWQDDCIT